MLTMMDRLTAIDALDEFSTIHANARIFAVKKDQSLILVDEGGDVYDLLGGTPAKLAASFPQMVVETAGWAAPVTNQDDVYTVAPSQHPERRRVRLLIMSSKDGVASAIRFSDDWENPIYDSGQARGPLAESVLDLYN